MSKLSGILYGTSLAMMLAAGCTSGAEEDGRDDSFITGGKADAAGIEEGSPQALGVLDVANTVSIEILDSEIGLSSHVVDNLMYFRLGDDGRPGTDDDGAFRSLAELDAIPFVGPIAFQRLLAYAEAKGFVDAHRTSIKLTFDGKTAPSLVAVRDGLNGAWRRVDAGAKTALLASMEFQAKVADRYVVAYVCEEPTTRSVTVIEEGRTLDDGALPQSCDFATGPQAGRVTGSMQQAGAVTFGSSSLRSSSDDWSFAFGSPAGTFDLVAASADRVAIRRAIKVAGDLALSPRLDLALEGTQLDTLAFTATNATMTETLKADIRLSTSSTFSAGIFSGLAGAARIVPGSILAANDRQTASIRGIDGGKFRALRRPVNATASTAFTLPEPIGERFAIEDGRLVVTWASLLPDLGYLSIDAQNFGDGQTAPQIFHSFDVTPAFVKAASVTRLPLDLDIPGFKPEWRIDFTAGYYRDVFVQSYANGNIATIQNGEDIMPGSLTTVPAHALGQRPRGAAQP